MDAVPRRSRGLFTALALLVAVAGLTGCEYTTKIRDPGAGAVSSQVLFAGGERLATLHSAENRTPVKLAAVAPILQTAVVAIEDQRFFAHDGVDLRAMIRAITRDVDEGKPSEGGSTITQQYVRNVILDDHDQTFSRKAREAVLAVEIEQKYSKKQILERYLNAIYFGNGAYGIQAASRLYFDVDAKDLTLAQSALLAGIIRSPEGLNPYKNADGALTRRNVVLDKMKELGRADATALAAARSAPLGVVPLQVDRDEYPAGHFVERVKSFILSNAAFGATIEDRRRNLFEGGLRIHTTLDARAQFLAESALHGVLGQPGDPAGALVSVDPTNGHVAAYVGGDYFGDAPYAKYDLAGQATRQPGSSFKPFVLAAALEAGVPLDRVYDAPSSIDIPVRDQAAWHVPNFPGTDDGHPMDLTEATVHSVNTVYAQLVRDVGARRVADVAAAAGVTTPLDPNLSIALGSGGVTVLDMASAFGTFAADGKHTDPVFVTDVTDRNGKVLYRATSESRQVMPVNTARTVNGVLQQVLERGTGVNARIGRAAAGKTGTTDNNANAWFVGYTPQLSTAVWIGFADAYRPMTPPTTRITVNGGTWPAEIWQRFTAAALSTVPSVAFPGPEVAAPPGSGTAVVQVPSVMGMAQNDAVKTLIAAGYTVDVQRGPSRTAQPGTVIAQDPTAGSPGGSGGHIRITVAVTPVTAVVPSVLGLPTTEARQVLEHAGFTVDVAIDAEPPPGAADRVGKVWKQSEAAGTQMDRGTLIHLTVNPDA